MPLQDWIHRLEEGGGAKFTKRLAAVLAFIVVAAVYDSLAYRGFSNQEAMESAQLASNIAGGRGYTTGSVQPITLYLLDRKNPGSAQRALNEGVPDVTTPPVYPAALASVMKIVTFDFTAKARVYQPELWIAIFNQVLLFFAALLLFSVARRLFDVRVAWLAVTLFCGTELFWHFTISGLSTILLEIIFLAAIRVLIGLEESSRSNESLRSIAWAVALGVLVALGALTRYSFGWILLPALAFAAGVSRARRRNFILVLVTFLVVVSPWLLRNFNLSGNAFGAAVYAPLEETPVFESDQLERSFNPEPAFKQMRLVYLREKLLANAREIVSNELPLCGGNWLSAFFLVGLLIPFRNPALRNMRLFVVGSILVWILTEAMARTHLSGESPQVNSENLLVLVAPLLFAYGAGLFYILLDQLNLVTSSLRAAAVGLFVVVLSLPLILTACSPPEIPANSPYAPHWLHSTARLITDKELMMSDIPWAISWYGQRQCLNLTLDDSDDFARANTLKPVNALFLTQRTTDSPLLSQLTSSTNSWGRFFWDTWAHGEVPTAFPLRKAPAGYLPDQMLLSDKVRWQ